MQSSFRVKSAHRWDCLAKRYLTRSVVRLQLNSSGSSDHDDFAAAIVEMLKCDVFGVRIIPAGDEKQLLLTRPILNVGGSTKLQANLLVARTPPYLSATRRCMTPIVLYKRSDEGLEALEEFVACLNVHVQIDGQDEGFNHPSETTEATPVVASLGSLQNVPVRQSNEHGVAGHSCAAIRNPRLFRLLRSTFPALFATEALCLETVSISMVVQKSHIR